MNATIQQLNKASEILRKEIPHIKAVKSYDAYPDLQPHQRGALLLSSLYKTKRLLQFNPR